MLVLRVEYLTGVCMATKHNDPTRSVAEWPPHPDRLYSALVAAAAESEPSGGAGLPDPAALALKWLARQGAPLLHAPRAYHRTTPAMPMPSNPHQGEVWQKNDPRLLRKGFELKTLLPVHREKKLLPIPAVVPDEPVVYFVWPRAEPDRRQETLRSICERVTYLGRSRSLVRVTVEDRTPAVTHVPDPSGDMQLRVPPAEGRLSYLIDKYARDGGKPEPSPPRRYRRVDITPPCPEGQHSIFDRSWIFQPTPGDPALPVEATVNATKALRRAVMMQIHEMVCGCERWEKRVPSCREARDCYARIPGVLSGYAPDCHPLEAPHLAFVSLPFVHPVQRHADGAIKGLAVLIPRDLNDDTSVLAALAKALVRLEVNGLRIPGSGRWRLKEVSADAPSLLTLARETWMGPSRIWTTATPMVFGHFPKPKNGGEAKVVLDSLELVGVDPSNVVEIAIDRHASLHGAPPSWCFKVSHDQSQPTGPERRIRHVTLQFDRPVSGPLAIGALRYFGLGLMMPLEPSGA